MVRLRLFRGTLKCEKYYLKKYDTYEALEEAVTDYMNFYNHERYQKLLNCLSPLEFRAQVV